MSAKENEEFFEEIEVDFSEDTNGTQESNKEASKTETEEEENSATSEEASENSEKKPKRRRPSRSAKRIQELASANNDLKERLARLEQNQQKSTKAAKSNAERDAKLRDLRSKEEEAQERYTKAMEDQDFAAAAKAQAEITRYATQVTALETLTPNVEDDDDDAFEENDSKTTKLNNGDSQQGAGRVPEGFTDFISNRDWVQHPEGRTERRVAQFLKNEAVSLEADGFNVYEDDFYVELENSLGDFLSKNGLEEDNGSIVESKKTPPRQKDASTTSNRASSNRSETTVRLTKADLDFIKQHNIDKKRYAASKLKREQAKGAR